MTRGPHHRHFFLVAAVSLLLQAATVYSGEITQGEEKDGSKVEEIVNENATTEQIGEENHGKQPKKSAVVAAGVLGSYLQGVGTQSLNNRKRTTTLPPPPPPPPSLSQPLKGPFWNVGGAHNNGGNPRPRPSLQQQQHVGGGGEGNYRPQRPPPAHPVQQPQQEHQNSQGFYLNNKYHHHPTIPPQYHQQSQSSGVHQANQGFYGQQQLLPKTPPPQLQYHQGLQNEFPPTRKPVSVSTSAPLIREDQKLAFQLLQMLEEKEKLEQAQKLHQLSPNWGIVTTSKKPIQVVQPTTDPDYYDYEPDYQDKTTTTTTTTTPKPTRRRRRRTTTTTSSPFAPFDYDAYPPPQEQQQPIVPKPTVGSHNFHNYNFVQQQTTPFDYDIDYLDVPRPKTTTPYNPPPPPPPVATPGYIQMTPEQYQQLLQLQYIMMLQRLQIAHQLNQTQSQANITTSTTPDPNYLAKVPGILIDPHIAPTRLTSTTDNPADAIGNIAGLFGSLAVGNLAGVVDNTLKLGGTGVFDNLNGFAACMFLKRCGDVEEPVPGEGEGGVGAAPAAPAAISPPIRKQVVQDRYPGKAPYGK